MMPRAKARQLSTLLRLATLAAIGACATSPSAAPVRPATQTIGSADVGGTIRIASGSGPDVATLPFALAQVWTALPLALDSLAIPITKNDASAHIIGNESFKIRQRLGKTALSRFLDCGQTQIGPNADSYDVMLTVLAQLQPASATSTTISTTVQAMAKPVTFNQGYSQCSSKGELETRLLNMLKAQLQR
jgi:hypothetical protein